MQIRNIKGIVERLAWNPALCKKGDGKLWEILAISLNRLRDNILSTDLDISECCEVDASAIFDEISNFNQTHDIDMECELEGLLSRLIAKSGCIRWKEVSDDRI